MLGSARASKTDPRCWGGCPALAIRLRRHRLACAPIAAGALVCSRRMGKSTGGHRLPHRGRRSLLLGSVPVGEATTQSAVNSAGCACPGMIIGGVIVDGRVSQLLSDRTEGRVDAHGEIGDGGYFRFRMQTCFAALRLDVDKVSN